MPKSRHRKIPFRTRVQQRKRGAIMDKQAEARRLIYDRAMPEFQEYPPTKLVEDRPRKVINQPIPSRVAQFVDVSKLGVGAIFELSYGAVYEKQPDGSIRRVRKQERKLKAA